ncbi:aldehyde dehydrogenase (NADP(+)) [Flagellimonas sp. HMM57]|uniref:aldehyde dehydrogenase (NADP(+)) n=1 Tax=unclassified Flagellimonas TaxID=2644544 RepID=UPI0013D44741|nr:MULTISPECIES: aldehyde dehydrogenase (NADP(+)) [unclassified Flagellimonas]UII76778.1 aldehyde dehydrogenase (NADP(+)) [Flagellimonas sp. HMM57]
MNISGKNILGNHLSSKGNTIFYAKNPSTGKDLATSFYEATEEEISDAINYAEKAFVIYREKSGQEKASFLDAIVSNLQELEEDLIKLCSQETGLPAGRLKGELGRTTGQLKLFASVLRDGFWVDARIDLANPERKPVPKPDIRYMQMPLGPVGVFGASNFPLAFSVAGGDTVSALAAGCTVVVKAHPLHPGTSELVAKAIITAAKKFNMPNGVFSMVHGVSHKVGQAIVRHPLIKAIGFTGSFKGGKALFDEAAKRTEPIPVYAEMGSVNPVFVLPQALKEKYKTIAKGLSDSVQLGVGQFCTNPGITVLPKVNETPLFKEELRNAISTSESATMLSASIQKGYESGLEKIKSKTKVKSISKGVKSGGYNQGAPEIVSVSTNIFLEDKDLEEEVFGPSTLLIQTQEKDEMLAIANSLHGHLTATVHGTEDDLKAHVELLKILERKVGRVLINGFPTGVEVSYAMVHGGPFPATTDARMTSVGTAAITRYTRPVCFQNFPDALLPDELKQGNPLNILRMVDGKYVTPKS